MLGSVKLEESVVFNLPLFPNLVYLRIPVHIEDPLGFLEDSRIDGTHKGKKKTDVQPTWTMPHAQM